MALVNEFSQDREESIQRAIEKKQAIADIYYRLFSTTLGQDVLAHMHERAWYTKSTFGGDGRDRDIRAAREGQRNFMLETDALIQLGKTGIKPPTQTQARSHSDGR